MIIQMIIQMIVQTVVTNVFRYDYCNIMSFGQIK